MSYMKLVNGVEVEMTPEEITERQSEEAIFEVVRQQRSVENLRLERNKRLSESDWTQLADAPIDQAIKVMWATYRQALRDLPANTSDPFEPVWPVKPT